MEPRIDVESQVNYWRQGAEMDWQSARRMWESGQDLHWALFLGHLACEKALKALVVQHTQDYAPYIHNLIRLSELAGLNLDDAQIELLTAVNQFNIAVRYPDAQYEFYRRCTPEFTGQYMMRIEEMCQWLLQPL